VVWWERSSLPQVWGYPANPGSDLGVVAGRWLVSAGAFEVSEFFFVAASLGGDGFKGEAELVDLHLESGEGECFAALVAVLFDDGAQFGSSVEGGPADAGVGGYGVKGDGGAGGEQMLAGVLDADGGFVGHGVSVWFMSWSRRSTRRRWRVASWSQPRASASAASASASARWVARMGRNVDSVRKFGQCSQMLA